MKDIGKYLFLASLCLALSCGGGDVPTNVVLIAVDTLRPDHMGCYGYDRRTTPYTDRLAQAGVLFENVVAPSPWTLPSFASVLTSLYPAQHGANGSRSPMKTSFPTLPEVLRRQGYATAAIINAPYLKAKVNINRGFDFYDMTPPEGRVAEGTTQDALEWIDQDRDGPFFIFVHYFDPHIPYAPAAPYDTLFDPDYAGHMWNSYSPQRLPQFRLQEFEEMKKIPPEDWNHIRSLYDGEIAFTDEAIGELLAGLKERNLEDRTLIVFLSDHGEEFFEHEGFEHGHSLFGELLMVPLIFAMPDRLPERSRIGHQVRLIDVAPTILDILGIAEQSNFEGVSLKPLIEGKAGLTSREETLLPPGLAYSESMLYGGEKKSLTAYPWKLIYDTVTEERSFFNLAEDPQELHDIADRASHSLDLLEESLFKTYINSSDTWFVEVAPDGSEHTFDLSIDCEVVRGAGRFAVHKIILSDGTIMNTEDLAGAEAKPSEIRIDGLTIEDTITIAVKLRRTDAVIAFDFRMDGGPATANTFIGQDLLRPVTMPFTEQDEKVPDQDKGEPRTRPDPPYFLVWLAEAQYGADITIELDEETEQELRSLGYVQ
jgi:arylsulfatase A-like enzyme